MKNLQLAQFTIPFPLNFSFEETLSFLDRGFDECLYVLSTHAVSKLIHFADEKGLVVISAKGDNLEVTLQKAAITKGNLEETKAYVSEWFDLKRDIQPFYNLLNKHPLLSDFVSKYSGSRLIGIPNLFEAICWAIIGQQINLTFAYKLKRLLVEKYGEKEFFNQQTYYSFPTPTVLQKADRETLIAFKFSRQKIDYLMIISNFFANNEINKTILSQCKSKKERIKKLTAIKGIGVWTANYVLMKSMRDMSCITYGDSGLNSALRTFFDTPKKPSKEEVDVIFKDFKGWESYLNFYFWKSLSPKNS